MQLSLLLTVALAAISTAHPQEVKPIVVGKDVTDSGNYTRCSQQELHASQRSALDIVPENRTYTYKSTRRVDTYVHIVTTKEKRDRYPWEMVSNQIKVMNEAYKSTGFTFTLRGADYTVQDSWAQASAGSDEEIQMKQVLRQGGYDDLNLYFLSDLGDGLLGFCYFPTPNPSERTRILDGCINLAASLPGGEARNYNEGMTAVHESGHWFGLYHVFDGNSCSGPGDYVGDTPRQSRATAGCPAKQNSCPQNRGYDSIHNFMDYSYDECLTEFTRGQSNRMRALFDQYRAGK